MIYAILNEVEKDKIILVKADSKEAVGERIKLLESERVVKGFTDREISALDTSAFTVVCN